MSKITTVGFIGLGDQGAPIALRIAAAGWPLHVWARRSASLEPFAGSGAAFAASPRELGQSCDFVGICVKADDDVRQVLMGGGNSLVHGLRPGSIVAVHSTVAPATMHELDAAMRAHGVDLLDAPVSGGPQGATAGTMTVMVGGERETFERARPVLDTFGAKVVLVGGMGAGQTVKLLNNNLCFANMGLGLAALDLAERLGLDRAVTADLILSSSGGSRGLAAILDTFVKYGGMKPDSSVAKDHHHFVDVLDEQGIIDDPVARAAALGAEIIDRHDRQIRALAV